MTDPVVNGAPAASLSSSQRLPRPVTTVDRYLDAEGLIRRAFTIRQLDGREPFVQEFTVDHPVATLSLLPPGAYVERSTTTPIGVVALASTPSGAILVSSTARSSTVTVSAPSDDAAAALVELIRARAPELVEPGTVGIRMWHLGCNGIARAHDRRIDAPS